MKSIKLYTIAIVSVFAFASCATIIHGSRENIGISSSPTNAEVTIDNTSAGKTPVNVKLSRKDNHVIKIKLNGYQPYELQVSRKVSGWIVGNIVFGGVIGLAVDAIDGSMYQLSPGSVNAMLGHSKMSVVNKKDNLYLAVVLKPNKDWKKIGTLTRMP